MLGRILVVLLGMIVTGLAAAPAAYMLWPVGTPITPDAPSLPVQVGGVSFNVPPGAIRFKVQRKSGSHPRIDMTFVWPSLTPPDPSIKPQPTDTPDRLNYVKMARIAQLSFDVLLRADEAALEPFVEAEDPVAFEAETFRRTAGRFFPLLCRWAGVKDLNRRADLDALADKLLSTGL